jgi:hypothetical protein
MRTTVVIPVKMKLVISVLFALVVAPIVCSIVRADVIPPQSILLDLKETVLTADDSLFRGYAITCTEQLKGALSRKIDAVIKMMDEGEYDEAYDKLEDDIAPKLTICETARIRARSWLSYDPELQDVVYQFSGECQELIAAIKLADPRPTPSPN